MRAGPIGIVAAHDKLGPETRFDDERPAARGDLRARAAVAVDLSERVSRDALRRVVEAQELERARLARELHDETGQALTSILLGLKDARGTRSADEAARGGGELRELVVTTLQDVRRLAVELRPSGARRLRARTGRRAARRDARPSEPSVRRRRGPTGERRLPAEVETALYRIVQEALTNVVKHASATV